MKMYQALSIIANEYVHPPGYMVHFEWLQGGVLESDYFPDKHAQEPLIATEDHAWKLAEKFAAAMKGRVVNVYVIDRDFRPVAGYKKKEIKNR